MAKKPNQNPTPAVDGEVLATVIDPLNHDGQDYAAGDLVSLPVAEANVLRGLGVVEFVDDSGLPPPATTENKPVDPPPAQ